MSDDVREWSPVWLKQQSLEFLMETLLINHTHDSKIKAEVSRRITAYKCTDWIDLVFEIYSRRAKITMPASKPATNNYWHQSNYRVWLEDALYDDYAGEGTDDPGDTINKIRNQLINRADEDFDQMHPGGQRFYLKLQRVIQEWRTRNNKPRR